MYFVSLNNRNRNQRSIRSCCIVRTELATHALIYCRFGNCSDNVRLLSLLYQWNFENISFQRNSKIKAKNTHTQRAKLDFLLLLGSLIPFSIIRNFLLYSRSSASFFSIKDINSANSNCTQSRQASRGAEGKNK